MSDQALAAERTGPVWRNRDFRWLWAGQSVSMLGTQLTTFAVPVFAITYLGADAGQLSLLRTMEFLPFLFLTLPVGVWVDRHPPRPAMVLANAVRGVAIGVIAVAGVTGVLHLSWLSVALLAVGAGTVVFDVAYLSYLPAVVGKDQLVDGNSKLSVSYSVAEVGGPGIAGLLIQVLSAPVVLLVDALSYLASVFTLTRIRTRDASPTAPDERAAGMRRQLAEGLAEVWRNPYLRTVSLESFTYNFFVQFGETLIALYALTQLGLSAGMLGLCISLGSVGGLVGAVVAPRVVRRFGFGPTFVAGTALGCVAPVLVPLADGPRLVSGALIAGAYLMTGFGVTISVIGSVTLRQTVAPAHLLGRVNAVMRLASYAAVPLGTIATGVAATALGARTALFVGVAGLLLPTVILLLSPVPRLRDAFDADRPDRLTR
jgi:Na+/melibiose symporter-like transporter